jgi:hypothetical protein
LIEGSIDEGIDSASQMRLIDRGISQRDCLISSNEREERAASDGHGYDALSE